MSFERRRLGENVEWAKEQVVENLNQPWGGWSVREGSESQERDPDREGMDTHHTDTRLNTI